MDIIERDRQLWEACSRRSAADEFELEERKISLEMKHATRETRIRQANIEALRAQLEGTRRATVRETRSRVLRLRARAATAQEVSSYRLSMEVCNMYVGGQWKKASV